MATLCSQPGQWCPLRMHGNFQDWHSFQKLKSGVPSLLSINTQSQKKKTSVDLFLALKTSFDLTIPDTSNIETRLIIIYWLHVYTPVPMAGLVTSGDSSQNPVFYPDLTTKLLTCSNNVYQASLPGSWCSPGSWCNPSLYMYVCIPFYCDMYNVYTCIHVLCCTLQLELLLQPSPAVAGRL